MSARLVIIAPNWLGDAIMALPAIADIHRAYADSTIAVAARPSVAPLFALVDGVDASLSIAVGDHHALTGFDVALLLPHAFRAALAAWRAGVPERWGYAADGRRLLLTRAIARPRPPLHQVAYYQHLASALGCPNGSSEPRVAMTDVVRDRGARALAAAGWRGDAPLVAVAPGAAYGGAKRWPPEYFAEFVDDLRRDGVQTVMVGSAADLASTREIAATFDLVGRTDIPTLAGVLAHSRTLVTNDSGAMHLAAAAGVPVTAVFGPTRDRDTHPIGDHHVVLTHDVWCRPCMLRECPLDHACMRGIAPRSVLAAARRTL